MTGQRAHKQNSVVTKCFGDEPGVGLGVKSNTVGSVCHRKTHSHNVRIEGQWATRDTDEWYMNNKNTVGKLVWYTGSKDFKPTPPLEPPSASRSQEGLVMSDATPMTFEPGKEYAFNDTTGQFTKPAQTQPTDTKQTASDGSRWWTIINGLKNIRSINPSGAGAMELMGAADYYLKQNVNEPTDWLSHGFLKTQPTHTNTPIDNGVPTDTAPTEPEKKQELEEKQTTAPANGRTDGNTKITGQQKRKRECRCVTGAYDDIKNVCGVECGSDYQAHHIVPDYTLRYGNRAEAEKGQKRIPGLPTFGQGPSICLKGYKADAGSEHGLAHQADEEVAKLGSGWSTPQGTADISSITEISRDAAVAATKGECEMEIVRALNAQPSLRSNILGRTTIMPPAEGTEPYKLLSTGTRATLH
ncbi:DUF4150 domain-containing protein, partial [Agrobacterium vitis]|uniref:DUF4150 domain-containing protein n=1 Tax=Allorhizobium ampelinum TaxID=3025782 RepID=UPI001F3D4982